MTDEAKFDQELELYRQECESAAQFFFGYLAIHEVARRREAVWELLNRNAMFWNTASGAMQTAAIIAVGRVFDQGSPHNIDRVLKLAQDSPSIFSRTALGRRKQAGAPQAPSWLAEYLDKAYVPVTADFRRLRAHVKKRRRIYEANYRDLRHKTTLTEWSGTTLKSSRSWRKQVFVNSSASCSSFFGFTNRCGTYS
jgi:hypothetical protein